MCKWLVSSVYVEETGAAATAGATTIRSSTQRQRQGQGRDTTPIIVYTDGSAFNNGKRNAKAGYAVVFPDYPDHTQGYPLEGTPQTNNRAEYTGAIKACSIADVIDGTQTRPLHIYTDSQLLINTATKWIPQWRRNGWKKKDKQRIANIDLVKQLDTLMSAARPIQFIYVQAHAGNQYNELADTLAKQGVQQQVLQRPTS
jgi:ribonuclease HI